MTMHTSRSLPRVLTGVVGLIALGVLIASLTLTERSSFCATCHEMVPYNEAWTASSHHDDAPCVACHVDSGLFNHLAHKFVALREVWDHFASASTYPTGADVPDSRCLACHKTIKISSTQAWNKPFPHARHIGRASCETCHSTVGHAVTAGSLRAAGVLAPSYSHLGEAAIATAPGVPAVTRTHLLYKGSQHRNVICFACHSLQDTGCELCHQPQHAARGACKQCHKPGDLWTPRHPTNANCQDCHTPPQNHFGTPCSRCHDPNTPFAETRFAHPTINGKHTYRSFACAKCHPDGYATHSCTCHGGNPPSGD